MSTGGGDDLIMARIGLDASQYGAAADDVIRFARRIEAEQKKVDRAIEDSQRRRAQLERDLTRAVAEGRLRDANRLRLAIEQEERKLGRAVEDSYQRQGQAADDLEARRVRAARRAAEAEERARRRAAEALAATARREAEQEERRRRAAQQEEARRRRAADSEASGIGRLATAGLAATAALTGISGALDGVMTYAAGLADMSRDMERLAASAVSMRNQQAETGGVLGVYGDELKDLVLNFQAQTTLESPERAEEFLRSFKSAMEIPLLRGQVDQAGFERMQLLGGQLAAAEGLPASGLADLLGLISTQTVGQLDPEKVMAQAQQSIRTLYAGVGDLALLPQLIEFAGANVDPQGNLLNSVPEAATMVALSSLSGSGGAGTRADALFRTVVSGLMRERNVSGATSTQGVFLRDEVGIASTDDPMARVTKLFEHLIANAPKDIPIDEYLAGKGFGQVQERQAIASLMKNARAGDFASLMDQARAASEDPNAFAGIMGSIDRRMGEDEAVSARAAAFREIAAQRAGSQAVPLEAMTDMMLSLAPAENRGGLGRFWDATAGRFTGRDGEEQYRENIRQRALQSLREAVLSRGLEEEAAAEIGGGYGFRRDAVGRMLFRSSGEGVTDQAEAIGLIRTLRDAGVNPTEVAAEAAGRMPGVGGSGTDASVAEQLADNKKTHALLERMILAFQAAGGAGAPPAAPPGGLND